MYHTQTACLKQPSGNDMQVDAKALQTMKKCLVQDFKHRLQLFGSEAQAREEAAQHVQNKLLFPIVAKEEEINSANTFMRVQAICEAAYQTRIPVSLYALWYVQHQAEQSGAWELVDYMQQQSKKFKKVHIWFKMPFSHFCWLPKR